MRLRSRVDANQKELTAAFRKLGCDVLLTHQLGKGYPDCFVGLCGVWIAVEFKSKKGKLTNKQKVFWRKLKFKPHLVRDMRDAYEVARTLVVWSGYNPDNRSLTTITQSTVSTSQEGE